MTEQKPRDYRNTSRYRGVGLSSRRAFLGVLLKGVGVVITISAIPLTWLRKTRGPEVGPRIPVRPFNRADLYRAHDLAG